MQKQQLTETQKTEFTKILRKMALESLGMHLFYTFLLVVMSAFTTLLGVIIVHSTTFCAITGFVNFICYYKLLEAAQKKQKYKYAKKFKEVLSK